MMSFFKEKNNVIFIRVDANEQIATGHVMRCATIAKELIEKDQEVYFLVADQVSRKVVESQGLAAIVLDKQWDDLKQEISQMRELLKQYRPDWLIIDTYYVTSEYFRELHKWTRVAYIDDLRKFHYECDILINYSVYASDMNYEKEYLNTKLLLGCKYAPLRNVFRELPIHVIKEDVQDILLLTGGSDHYHVALNFVNEITKQSEMWANITFHIVCGRFNLDMSELEEIARKCENIKVYPFVEHIEILMQKADIAISAGGSTLYELCACGTPTITYCMADNQLQNVEKFADLGLMEYSGDIRKDYSYNILLDKLGDLAKDKYTRSRCADRLTRMVDGTGAMRITEQLLNG